MKSVDFLKNKGVDVDKSLELFGDMNIYNETMQDFLDGINEKKNNLATYKSRNDWANYAIFAHSIKSDARYLGFTNVAEVALQHEMAGKESNQHFIEKDYNHLLQVTDEMTNVIKEYLSGSDNEITREDVNNGEYPKKTLEVNNNGPVEAILVADDSKLVSNFATKMLQDKYTVVTAKDGEEVFNVITSGNYKILCLLLDLNMPNIGGFEVLDYFKENNLFNQIPVSIITGENSRDAIKKAFTYDICDMLVKPFSKDDIKRVVEKTIGYKK